MMIDDIVKNKMCFGCGACEQICTKNAIEMKPDSEGFLIPIVHEALCVKCGACRNVCQALFRCDGHEVNKGLHYIVQSQDYWNAKRSASGGAFWGIASFVIQELKGVVFGCAMTDGCKVRHVKAQSMVELKTMQNSKYVQSEIGHVYSEVANSLDEKRYVLFSGTPCQVSGLYNYIKRYKKIKDEYLITMDLICHGVPSPMLFHQYTSEVQTQFRSRFKNIRFRYKNPIFKSRSKFVFLARFSNGKCITQHPTQNPYFNIFLKGFAFRDTCYGCPYAKINRLGDFTVGDCDSHDSYPNFHPDESNSVLMINTEKAKILWKSGINRRFDFSSLDIKLEASYNKQLNAPFVRPAERNDLYIDFKQLGFNAFCQKYSVRQSRYSELKVKASMWIPDIVFRMKAKLHNFVMR